LQILTPLNYRTYFYNIGNMENKTAVVALEALAQESRLQIFRLLVNAGPDGLPAGKIAKRLKLPSPTLSFHLAQLKNAGLLTCERQSRLLIYSANFRTMNALVAFLTENCCHGDPTQCVPVLRQSNTKKESK